MRPAAVLLALATATLLSQCALDRRPPVDAATAARAQRDIGFTLPDGYRVTEAQIGKQRGAFSERLEVEPADRSRRFAIALRNEPHVRMRAGRTDSIVVLESGCRRQQRDYAAEFEGKPVQLATENCDEPGGLSRIIVSDRLPFRTGSLWITGDGDAADFDNDAFRAIIASIR